jgi:hypothetical protein
VRRSAWVLALGAGPDAQRALALSGGALAPSSTRSYGAHWSAFVAFCEQRGLCPLPASPATVVLYTAWQSGRRLRNGAPCVAPTSFQPYLSAINTVHGQVLGPAFPVPAAGAWLSAVRAGWRREFAARTGGQQDVTVALPASVVTRLASALAAAPTLLARSIFHTIVGFTTLMRPSSSTALARTDVHQAMDGYAFRPRVIKGGGAKPFLPAAKVFPTATAPWMTSLARSWERKRDLAWSTAQRAAPLPAELASYWALPDDAGGSPQELAESWLDAALRHVDARAPMGAKYTPRCLRKGGASAFVAEAGPAVDMGALCHLGDWAIGSLTPSKHYVDRSVLPDEHTNFFFGFRLRR